LIALSCSRGRALSGVPSCAFVCFRSGTGIEWFQPTRLIPASSPDETSILTGTMMAARDRPGLVD
jgi:hypothetical protein